MLTDSLEAARLARSGGRWHEALACYEAAIPIAARHGSPDDVADLFLDIGDLHRERGDLELAAEAFGVAVAISEANGERRMLTRALTRLGTVLVEAELPAEAEAALGRARHLAESHELTGLTATIELACTELFALRGESERALVSCEHAFELFRSVRSASGLAETHRWYATLFRMRGQESLARAHLGAATEAARACGDRRLEAEALREWAAFHLSGGRHRDSIGALNAAWRLYADLNAEGELFDLDGRLDALEEEYLLTVRAWAELV